jgi:hypothetical protein
MPTSKSVAAISSISERLMGFGFGARNREKLPEWFGFCVSRSTPAMASYDFPASSPGDPSSASGCEPSPKDAAQFAPLDTRSLLLSAACSLAPAEGRK